MDRKSILKSPGYWVTTIQNDLYECAERFMEQNDLNRTQLAQYLSVSKGYVTQLLNGDYDHRLSKMVDLALGFGYVPRVEFVPVEEYIKTNEITFQLKNENQWRQTQLQKQTGIYVAESAAGSYSNGIIETTKNDAA